MNGKVDLTHHSFPKPVQDIVNVYKNGLLNLSPGFQRDSVWTERDRSKLIDSIIRNYPLPAIFLYCREHNGQIIYDVIDGKQRIETILMFMGLLRGKRFHIDPHSKGGRTALDNAALMCRIHNSSKGNSSR